MNHSELPGEHHPITFEERARAGRTGRVTPEEALGVFRRLNRKQQNRAPIQSGVMSSAPPEDWEDGEEELPEDFDLRRLVAMRLPPRLMAFVRAKAEIEGLTVTAVVEDSLRQYVARPPVDKAHRG